MCNKIQYDKTVSDTGWQEKLAAGVSLAFERTMRLELYKGTVIAKWCSSYMVEHWIAEFIKKMESLGRVGWKQYSAEMRTDGTSLVSIHGGRLYSIVLGGGYIWPKKPKPLSQLVAALRSFGVRGRYDTCINSMEIQQQYSHQYGNRVACAYVEIDLPME
ncbi:hypothetical protein BCR42DRAFT_496079 [Absidia repens]|uniref:Uncharacterized protein n=1 Tax=Absidia repens TaxID=90262 RepID=A0A1X2I188_9FUNG|nr:hypothetical protein BCR42DRAFT_496079 [Absidia repens]